MKLLHNKKVAITVAIIATILAIPAMILINSTVNSGYPLLLIAIIWGATILNVITTILWEVKVPSDTIEESPQPSKGTSNADRLGVHTERPVTPKEAYPKAKISSGVSSTIEIEGKLLKYDKEVKFPTHEVLERLLTDDELAVMEKHYHGFYHDMGVNSDGHIRVAPRANSRYSTHYTTPEILAEYILELED
jgi:hypothetical protein